MIQAAVRRLSPGRTTLIIAHRLSTVVDADEILAPPIAVASSRETPSQSSR